MFFFYFSVGFVGNIAGLPQCTVPSALSIVIRMRLVIRQPNLPSCLVAVQLALGKTLSGICVTGLAKLTNKMDEICINGKLPVQEPSEWKFFFVYLWVILRYIYAINEQHTGCQRLEMPLHSCDITVIEIHWGYLPYEIWYYLKFHLVSQH